MTDWIPVSDPPPPDDYHTWARPAPEPCPSCECCTRMLCETARERRVPCCWLSPTRPGYMDVSDCPCDPTTPKETTE